MNKSYGIKFCQHVLTSLAQLEDELFDKQGYGFTYNGLEHQNELKYKGLLKQFKREKELGLEPSYDPNVHGDV